MQLSNFPQALVLVMHLHFKETSSWPRWERRIGVIYLNNEVSVLLAESGKVGGKSGGTHFFLRTQFVSLAPLPPGSLPRQDGPGLQGHG